MSTFERQAIRDLEKMQHFNIERDLEEQTWPPADVFAVTFPDIKNSAKYARVTTERTSEHSQWNEVCL